MTTTMDRPYHLNTTGEAHVEVKRLNAQHEVITAMTGGIAPPDVLAVLQAPSARIADIGTGSCAWLLQTVSQTSPTAHFDGYDITDAQFPVPESLPANVSLHLQNMLEPFPEDVLGSYDIVHCSLLVCGLRGDEWAPAVKNLKTLLKPGGFLFWLDVSYSTATTVPPSLAFHRLLDIEHRFGEAVGRDTRFYNKLAGYFREAGLVDVHKRDFMTLDHPELDNDYKGIFMRVEWQALNGILARGGIEGMKTVEDMQRVLGDLQQDLDNGTSVGIVFSWFWGRNP